MQYAMVIEGKSVYLDFSDLNLSENSVLLEEKIKALGVVPVKTGENIAGVVNIASHIHREMPESTRAAAETAASMLGSILINTPGENLEEKIIQLFATR